MIISPSKLRRKIICVVAAFIILAAWTAIDARPLSAERNSSYWLDKIMMCESGGDPLAENLNETETHWDGRVGSFGLFQFAEATWQVVAKNVFDAGLTKIDWSHMPPHYAPPEIQRKIAYFTWDGGEGWQHWFNCAHMVGYVDTIHIAENTEV